MRLYTYKLGELFSRFSSGKNITSERIADNGDFPVYGGNGLRGYTNEYNFVGECLIIGRQGAKCGNVHYFQGKGFMTDHAIVCVCKKEYDTRFLVFVLSSLNLNRLSGQAAQPGLSVSMLKKQKIQLPSFKYQFKIGGILLNYDKIIEKNNKRIKILEQMIENIYKEWFVRFRFPGFKNTEFTNGIPFGWNYITLDKIVSFDRGISYSSDEIECDDGVNLINLKNIQSYGGFRREGTKKYNGKFKESQVVKKGDLILGVTDMTQDRRTVGHVAMIPTMEDVCVISADLVKINSKISKVFLYSMFRYGFYSKYFSQFANGANVLHLKPSVLMNKKILMPSKELIDEFSKKVSPMMEMIDKLNLMNGNLIKQRDYLLPRLMSGKLEV